VAAAAVAADWGWEVMVRALWVEAAGWGWAKAGWDWAAVGWEARAAAGWEVAERC
jgi:hypothetical protein